MDDLISRQAAIDALLGITKFQTRRELVNRCDASIADSEGWLGGVAECINEIYDLPSAEPVRCRECVKWNTVFDRNKAEYGLCKDRSQLEATRCDDFCSRAERKPDD